MRSALVSLHSELFNAHTGNTSTGKMFLFLCVCLLNILNKYEYLCHIIDIFQKILFFHKNFQNVLELLQMHFSYVGIILQTISWRQ